jgi:type IV secretory pathway VirB6-like protein
MSHFKSFMFLEFAGNFIGSYTLMILYISTRPETYLRLSQTVSMDPGSKSTSSEHDLLLITKIHTYTHIRTCIRICYIYAYIPWIHKFVIATIICGMS